MSLDPIKPAGTLPPADPEPVTLRRATLADAAALAAIGSATVLEAFTWMLPGADLLDFALTKHTAASYTTYLEHPDTRITLALAGPPAGFDGPAAAPVGYAMLTAPELPTIATTPADIELKRIYLFSRFRSAPVRGTPVSGSAGTLLPGVRASQALMDAAIADARALHRTRLLLGTHANNQRAIGFYRRNGFTEVGTRTFQVGTLLCSDLIFAKIL